MREIGNLVGSRSTRPTAALREVEVDGGGRSRAPPSSRLPRRTTPPWARATRSTSDIPRPSYAAANAAIEVTLKRYRYTGQERDEETGLAYHGARYYAPWLTRWTSSDPIGSMSGENRFAYVRANPVRFQDLEGLAADEPGWLERHLTKVLGTEVTINAPSGPPPSNLRGAIEKFLRVQDPPLPEGRNCIGPQPRQDARMRDPMQRAKRASALSPVDTIDAVVNAPHNLGVAVDAVNRGDVHTAIAAGLSAASGFAITAGVAARLAKGLRSVGPTRTPGAARVVGSIGPKGGLSQGDGFHKVATTRQGTDVLLAKGDLVLPSGKTLSETGLQGCKGCGDSAIATGKTLSGEHVTAKELQSTRVRNTDRDVRIALTPNLGTLELRTAPTFEKAITSKLGQMPNTRGILVPRVRGAMPGEPKFHVLNFEVDSKGNVRLYDATGDLEAK